MTYLPTLTSYDSTLTLENIHHARASVIPKLPNNILDLHYSMKKNIKRNQNKNVLLVYDYENNILVFSTITNLKF